jgi:hypothetical protein
VLRALASSFLSLLLVATLTWGGCISCEQYFMWPGAKTCCAGNGHCKSKPAKQKSVTETKQTPGPECKQIAFGCEKPFDHHIDLPAIAGVNMDMPVLRLRMLARWDTVSPIAPSPPDLQVLHSTFLI